MPMLNLWQATSEAFHYSFGDPRPLAELPEMSRRAWRQRKNAAAQWAAKHPRVIGYICIPYGDGGFDFYKVTLGKAKSASAWQCMPKFFDWLKS